MVTPFIDTASLGTSPRARFCPRFHSRRDDPKRTQPPPASSAHAVGRSGSIE
jgi:hypothetical protein